MEGGFLILGIANRLAIRIYRALRFGFRFYLFLLLEQFIQPVKTSLIGNAATGTVFRMVGHGEVIVGVPVKQARADPAVIGDLIFHGDIRQELKGGSLRLLGGKPHIQSTAQGKCQSFFQKTFAYRQIQIRAVIGRSCRIIGARDIFCRGIIAIVKTGIEVDAQGRIDLS